MLSLNNALILQARLYSMEHIAKQGVIPGELDSIELERLIGRIKELKFVLGLLYNPRNSRELE